MQVALDYWSVLDHWPILLTGVLWTVGLTAISALLGVSIGVLLGWAKENGPMSVRTLVGIYVEFIRNTPFIVQLFFVFFGLPAIGVRLSPEAASVIAMVVNLGAYATEIVRAGIMATPKGQIEAAMSLALSRFQLFFYVVLPPALRKVWPALVSQIIIVMLGSAVCGQISTPELSYAANLIQSRNFRAFESYIVATVLYLLLAIGLRALLNWVGQRFLFGMRHG